MSGYILKCVTCSPWGQLEYSIGCCLRNCPQLPFTSTGLRRSGFWNRLVRQAGALAHDVLQEEIALALDGWDDGCAAQLLRFTSALGVDVWQLLPRGVRSSADTMRWLVSRPLPASSVLSSTECLPWQAFGCVVARAPACRSSCLPLRREAIWC